MQNSKCRIISGKEPSCFALFEISCYICVAVLGLQTYRKCFSHCPTMKMWKFSKLRDIRIALISCIYAVGMLYANVLLYTGVGHAAFILLKVIPQPSIQ